MHPFEYSRPSDLKEALALKARTKESSFIAGGTTMVDLMKLDVLVPEALIDISRGLGLDKIEKKGNSVFVGALVSNSDLAFNKIIKEEFPVLSQAVLSGASAQLRNMASVGGNIMQKNRCPYYRDTAFACNKREPNSGCPAIEGFNRGHAILGGSEACVAVHASDMCVALLALDAILHLEGANGTRSIKMEYFHLLPGTSPHRETLLEPGELIAQVEIPISSFAKNSYYLKVRDRASYAFALCSAAVACEIERGKISSCRVALGGVASKPWRAHEAEKILQGKVPAKSVFKEAAASALSAAKPLKHNAFKIELCKRTIVRALEEVCGVS